MQLFAFGINHNTAPLNIREQVTFNENTMEHALHDLVGNHAVKEAAIVSTCNRTEIYCSLISPKIRSAKRAAAAAIDTEQAPISVDVRTSLATKKVC